jgi:hypothetical protein
MGSTRRFRFRTYHLVRDDSALPTYAVECVSGEDADCGATSGERVDQGEVDQWASAHAAETGHARFRRGFHDYVQVVPGDWR